MTLACPDDQTTQNWLQPAESHRRTVRNLVQPPTRQAHSRPRPVSPSASRDGAAEPGSNDAPPRARPGRSARRPAATSATRTRRSWTGGPICGLFAVDIAGFTDPYRDENVQLYLRDSLYRILERAFNGSGVPWRACQHEDRGDGALIIVPPAIPVDSLADPLPERLCGLVRVHNRLSSRDAQIQLRTAAHIGRVYRDDHGFTGDAASYICRLLDTPHLKHLLAASSSDLAFITSDYFYDTVIRRHPTLVDPAAFQPVSVDLRHAQAASWVQLLGSAPPAAQVLPFDRPA